MEDCIKKCRFQKAGNGLKKDPTRAASGDKNGSRTMPDSLPRGENHVFSKLTNDRVIELRRDYSRTPSNMAFFEKKFMVNRETLRCALRGITWKHV
jgi:hypothetical protein